MSLPPRTQPSRRVKTRSLCGSLPSDQSFKTTGSGRILDNIGEGNEVKKFKTVSQHDPTYDPKKSDNTSQNYVSSEVKQQLCAICPAPKRCMVTLESAGDNPVDICHILAHKTKPRLIKMLQQEWAMKGPLNVNIAENLAFLRVDMHRSFDKGHWALFPERKLLDKILGAYAANEAVANKYPQTDLFHKFGAKKGRTFEYRLVWLKDSDLSTIPPILRRRRPPAVDPTCIPMDAIANLAITNAPPVTAASIEPDKLKSSSHQVAKLLADNARLQAENIELRQRLDQNCDTMQGAKADSKSACVAQVDPIFSTHEAYAPPYSDFPVMESHLHPLLVIYNAGKKISGIENVERLERIKGLKTVVVKTEYMYNLWTASLRPQKAEADPQPQQQDASLQPQQDASLQPPQHDKTLHSDHRDEDGEDDDSEDEDDDEVDEVYGDGDDDEDDDGDDDCGDGANADDHDNSAGDANENDYEEQSSEEDQNDDRGPTNNDAGNRMHHRPAGTGNPAKPRGHAEKSDNKQGIQDAQEPRRDHSVHINTSTDTPDLVGDDSKHGSVGLAGFEAEAARRDSDTNDYDELERWISKWAASAEPESNLKLTNDHQLRGYNKEPARRPPLEQWERWARNPPDLPMEICDTDDTSHYTSYLWSLYYEDANLLAPDGSPYRVPKPWNPY